MLTVLVPVLAALVGALVGAGVSFALSRARLSLVVDRIRMTPSQSAEPSLVPVNAPLLDKLEASPNCIDYASRVTSPERTYVTYLRLCAHSLSASTPQYEMLTERANQLRQLAASADWVQLESTYAASQRELWALAEVRVAQGREVFPASSAEPERGDTEPFYAFVDHQPSESWLMDLPGLWVLGFNYGTKNPVRMGKAQELGGRVVRAFSYRDSAELIRYFEAIREEALRVREQDVELARLVESELMRFDRLRVDFLVSNSGRAAVSLAPEAAAAINLKGYLMPDQSGSPTPIARNPSVRLRLASERLVMQQEAEAREASRMTPPSTVSAPIMIAPGETVRVVATSETLLDGEEFGGAMRTAYVGGERTLQLVLGSFRVRRWWQKKNRSIDRITGPSVVFRDLRFGQVD